MAALAQSLVAYVLLCAVGTSAGLAVLGAARPDLSTSSRLWLSPVTCLAVWAVFLGSGVALGIPVRLLVWPLWTVTLALAGWGVWTLSRGAGSGLRAERALLMVGLAIILPVAALWPFFWYGLADYPGSVAPDGWSYVAYGQFLWDHHRFEDGGLAPLYQYASHLSITRHVSASLLGFLGVWMRLFDRSLPPGDTQVGMGLLFAWSLYGYGMACAAVGTLAGLRPVWTACYLILAVLSGWAGNLVYMNNLDNGLALAFFPAVVTLVAGIAPGSWRSGVHLGLVGSGLLYTQAELAAPVCAATGFLALLRPIRERLPRRAWALTLGLALGVALLLTAPYLRSLVAFVRLQSYNALTVRVGGTMFEGLLSLAHYPAAFWGLGTEHGVRSDLLARNLLGGAFSLAALTGLWALIKQRQYALAFTVGLVIGGFGFLTLAQGYGYGAYKALLMGWWSVALLPVAGLAYLCRGAGSRTVSASAAVLALLGSASTTFHEGTRITRSFGTALHDSMRPVRGVREIAGVVDQRGILLAVDDAWANQWAVHYLRDRRLRVGARRSYMEQPWVAPFLERAAPVPLEDIGYVLTDTRLDAGLGGQPVWSVGPFRLWSVPRRWVAVADIRIPGGVGSRDGRPLLWLGADAAELDILTPQPGWVTIGGTVVPGPGAPSDGRFRVRVTTDQHQEDAFLVAGEGRLTVPVAAERNRVVLRALDGAPPGAPKEGESAILGIQDLRVRLAADGGHAGHD